MEIILHVGAHRCASTSFQCYMRANTAALLASGTGFWGPHRLRKGLMQGLGQAPVDTRTRQEAARARSRVRAHVAKARGTGLRRLIVSDENMLGSVRANLRGRALYRDAGERMARMAAGFDQVKRVHLTVRPQHEWWASALSYAVLRGAGVPRLSDLESVADNPRSWRDVIMDISCAMPGAEIVVTPFHAVAGQAHVGFAAATAERGPQGARGVWANKGPNAAVLRDLIEARGQHAPEIDVPRLPARWQPFSRAQNAALQHQWIRDFTWLAAGADGFARLVETQEDGLTVPIDTTEETQNVLAPEWAARQMQRGHQNERPQGYLG